ncbi:MAG: TetR/AcrR family transcriptional regulator [Oscillospiraceae bacterium]|nr:TetR/AcrR family transcriptional regulator [Oscillospiraceae bacterium]
MGERKTDRRTVYTKALIKDTLLAMLEEMSFDRVTVAGLCRRAELNRSTFYLHYEDMPAVFEELLDDAMSGVTDLLAHLSLIFRGEDCCAGSTPFCLKIRNEKYRVLFTDDALTGRILGKLAAQHRDGAVQSFTESSDLTPAQAEALFLFQISGCFAVARRMMSLDDPGWAEIRRVLDQFIRDGFGRYFEPMDR